MGFDMFILSHAFIFIPVPCLAVEGHFARLGVDGADAVCLAVAAYQAHSDALRQFLVGSRCATGPGGVSIVFTLSGPFSCMNALPRRQSRYTQANSAANAATQ